MLLYHTFTIISIFEKRFDRIFLHFGEKRRGRKKRTSLSEVRNGTGSEAFPVRTQTFSATRRARIFDAPIRIP